MIPDSLRKWQVLAVAAQAITGAAPQVVNGAPVDLSNVQAGTLAARINLGLTTTSLAITAKWQVKNKAGTWIDVANGPQNPAGVALQTGTGSLVTAERVVPAPGGIYGFKQARVVLTSSGAVGAGGVADIVNVIDYSYLDAWVAF